MTYAAAASEPVQTNLLYHLRDIRKTRAGADGFSLHIAGLDVWPGEKVALVGPSGMGKSTALDLLSLSLRPDSPDGEVPGDCFVFSPGGLSYDIGRLWNSGDDESLAPLRLRYLGYVLQTGGLLPFLSTMDNIQVLREAKGLPRLLEADRIFSQMGIAHLLKKMPSTLSVGERQRVAVARAVAAEPAVILADEPTAALDRHNAQRVLDLFADCLENTDRPVSLIMATHLEDARLLDGFRVCVIQPGDEGSSSSAILNAVLPEME